MPFVGIRLPTCSMPIDRDAGDAGSYIPQSALSIVFHMATASDLDNIHVNKINEGLGSFRRLFESTRAELGVAASQDAVQVVFSTVATAAHCSCTRALPSQSGRANLLEDLFTLGSGVYSNDFDIESAIPLVERVVNNAPCEGICSAVSDLVALTSPKPITPPTAFEKTVFDTPLRSSSASQRGIEQTHDGVDQRILEELAGRVYYDVGGFYKRYFEGKSWTNNARDIYEESRAQSFFEWLMKFQDTVLSGLGRKYYTSVNKVLRGSEADRKLDIFLAPADAAFQDGEHDWSNVLVIGEHKRNPDEDGSTKTLVQLAGYAREVFGSQPDRSGPYSSEKFDIHREPERFVKVIAGYALMTDAELGLNTFIKHDENGKFIVTRDVRISLEGKPIASTKAIVYRGTTCYRGRRSDSIDWEYVVKFAWPSDKRHREGDLLKLGKERGVKGIAEWFNHEQIAIDGSPDTIASLRKGMEFGPPQKLSIKASWVDNGMESSRENSRTRSSFRGRSRSSVGRLTGLGITTSSTSISSGQKRKRDERVAPETGAIKRSRSDDSQVVPANAKPDVKENELDNFNIHSIEEPEADSLAGCESETYGNRIHCCLVVSPAGRPLQAYMSVRELLEALRDAIAGHRSLVEDGKLLHRDISENNIIITESSTEGAPKGRLIDLDLAKELDSVPSGASHRTGTMQFMAVEVLEGKGHTYRHDLESFLYVFIWMCIRYGHEDGDDNPKAKKRIRQPAAASCLRDWYTGTYTQIARNKLGDMDKNRFEDIIAYVLFPIRDGAIFTGTFRNSDIMYDGMINAFSRAIGGLGKEEQATA
ncbi:hypothetical protein B0J14DRAFT_619990 [Halenospora varia]|nr:hypothetical protein B0J14DRAFT_619990 [Halenospora varia]